MNPGNLQSSFRKLPMFQSSVYGLALFALFASFPLSLSPAYAQDGSFTASADRTAAATGEQIEVTFMLNGSSGAKNFRAPAFKDFDVASGPNQSTNMQFINGAMSSSVSYSFVLVPHVEGRLIIGPATIEYAGKTLQTQPIAITVTKGAPPKQNRPSATQESADIGRQIGDNLFIKVSVDKSKAVQGEQITATYKLYNRVRLSNLNISKIPALTGFWNEDIDEIKQVQFTNEVYNGKQYNVAVLKKVALFPQRSGTLEIDPMEVNCVVQIQSSRRRSNDIFDQFFNDPFFGNVSNANYKIQSEPVKINVAPLPSANIPDGFGGAVGKFAMEAWLDKQQTKTNEPVTLKVKITGKGNLKLLGAPNVVVPPDVERYDPKISDNMSRDGNQIAGSRTFEYLLIPRHAGDQHIASFPFSYFDIERKAYVKLSSPDFVMGVEKGSGVSSGPAVGISKEDVKLLGEDIRFIRSESNLRRRGESFVGSPTFMILSVAPLLSFIGMLFFVRKRERVRGDVAGTRKRKARKMAQGRLAVARKLLDQKKKEEFYTEISRALWGYVGDKLSLPPSDLSVDAVRDSLASRGVTADSIGKLVSTMERCEFARFAPSADSTMMDAFYGETVELVSTIESEVR